MKEQPNNHPLPQGTCALEQVDNRRQPQCTLRCYTKDDTLCHGFPDPRSPSHHHEKKREPVDSRFRWAYTRELEFPDLVP